MPQVHVLSSLLLHGLVRVTVREVRERASKGDGEGGEGEG